MKKENARKENIIRNSRSKKLSISQKENNQPAPVGRAVENTRKYQRSEDSANTYVYFVSSAYRKSKKMNYNF